jgi:hypothetical protein
MTCGCEGRNAVPQIVARLRRDAQRGRAAFSEARDDVPPLARID